MVLASESLQEKRPFVLGLVVDRERLRIWRWIGLIFLQSFNADSCPW